MGVRTNIKRAAALTAVTAVAGFGVSMVGSSGAYYVDTDIGGYSLTTGNAGVDLNDSGGGECVLDFGQVDPGSSHNQVRTCTITNTGSTDLNVTMTIAPMTDVPATDANNMAVVVEDDDTMIPDVGIVIPLAVGKTDPLNLGELAPGEFRVLELTIGFQDPTTAGNEWQNRDSGLVAINVNAVQF